MYLLFNKETSKLQAYSPNDLSDQASGDYVLHEADIEINLFDIQGYSLVDGSVVYNETQEHKEWREEREAIPTRAELLAMVKELQEKVG